MEIGICSRKNKIGSVKDKEEQRDQTFFTVSEAYRFQHLAGLARLGENLIKAAATGAPRLRAFTNYRTKWNYIMQHLHSDNYAVRF